MSENTLRRCMVSDILGLKDWISQAIDWYIHNADRLRDMERFFIESEDDILSAILSSGMRELETRMGILGDAKRGDEL